ncbi:HD domain-containing protein [Streptococcus iniae]|uniref:bis(5'-nucleosyl)-tetraphosphatase (symmetrical) YqeK n=1 Tax=Streptococcus iniae TaxID=1346 RepID=UPI0008DA1E43|nr:bis(5'-nucleosyl)-tetraphosphatase (symmetrical) YqeK [Streptococcus iniae]OHX27080.1 HD domain-containing protein [Streptococcus iniae]RLV27416.1 HD domain-containing protein [Streptococcus iniae]
MSYSDYVPYTRQELLEKIALRVSKKRFEHILGVEQSAIALAELYDHNRDKAGLAALLHDYAKELSDSVFLNVIDYYQLNQELKNWNNNIWHGMVGRYIISDEFELKDEEILHAIEVHTVGAAKMSQLDKILYVADYIEPGRTFPIVEKARRIAQESLDKAVAFSTANTVAFLASQSLPIYPQTIETYNAFCHYLKED